LLVRVYIRGIADGYLVLASRSLFLVLLAPRKISLSFFCAPYVEPRSDIDLDESLRESLLGDLLGK
jgi:hypothetical protein